MEGKNTSDDLKIFFLKDSMGFLQFFQALFEVWKDGFEPVWGHGPPGPHNRLQNPCTCTKPEKMMMQEGQGVCRDTTVTLQVGSTPPLVLEV